MSGDIPIAQSKSAVDKIRCVTFAKKTFQFTPSQGYTIRTLEQERKETQEEISKLTLMISDDSIEKTDDETLEVNQEINRLMEIKADIEKEIYTQSEGKVSYGFKVGSATHFKYFGRAKAIKANLDKIEQEKKEGEKRKVFTITTVTETDKADIVREKLAKSTVDPQKAKKTRFDSDSDNSD